jgi:DNA-binding transcriptional LysR family regulator
MRQWAVGLEVFLAVARLGSLRAAAATLGVQPPAVSQHLKSFETQIGATLFSRTTRSVQLTEAGRALLQQAGPAFAELIEALDLARGVGRTRSGTIRLTLPYRAYQLVIAPKLAELQRLHPEIVLELSLNEGLVDVVRGGFHAGIRLGDRIDQDMIALRLTPPLKGAYFAAPSYLAHAGRPRHPRDLLQHNCIRYRNIASGTIADWQFTGPDGLYAVEVTGNLVFNDFRSVVDAAVAGLGIGWSLRPGIGEELRSGQLVSLLDRHVVTRPSFYLYFPKANARIEIPRIFIEFLKQRREKTTPPA